MDVCKETRIEVLSWYSNGMSAIGLTCQQSADEYNTNQHHLVAAREGPESRSNRDIFSVFMLGAPLGSAFGGDKQGELATVKGQQIAPKARLRDCNVIQRQPAEADQPAIVNALRLLPAPILNPGFVVLRSPE